MKCEIREEVAISEGGDIQKKERFKKVENHRNADDYHPCNEV